MMGLHCQSSALIGKGAEQRSIVAQKSTRSARFSVEGKYTNPVGL